MRIKIQTLRYIIREALDESQFAQAKAWASEALAEDEDFDSYEDDDETNWAGIGAGVGGALLATNLAGVAAHHMDKRKKRRR